MSCMETVGFLELNSIAKGIESADAILKAANVKLVFSRANCPGKYQILFTGEVAAVTASLEAGLEVARENAVDHCVIPRVHRQVVNAINMSGTTDEIKAVGVMEFFSVTAAIYSADAAVKAAAIDLIEMRLGTGIGGKSFVVMTGEVAAVSEAVSCGINCENALGMLVSKAIIPNPHPELFQSLI